MIKLMILIGAAAAAAMLGAPAQAAYETDVIPTSDGPLEITFIGHGSLMFRFGGRIVHVDPYSKLGDYQQLPKADLILLTHEHRDHLDPTALAAVRTDRTKIILTEACASQVPEGRIMRNGDTATEAGLKIEAIPAYNIVNMRSPGEPFHPKGNGNGYVITFGDKRVYVAGDTENTPEMKALKDIDVAFLPMNLPYTMTPDMVADAAKAFRPKILYPYHFGQTDTSKLVDLMKDAGDIEIRIRSMP